jgi:hypothetical protein
VKLVGTFDFERPLSDLATVFDMCGLQTRAAGHQVCAEGEGLSVMIDRRADGQCHLTGAVTLDANHALAAASQLALALEADGIRFDLELQDADGATVRRYRPLD